MSLTLGSGLRHARNQKTLEPCGGMFKLIQRARPRKWTHEEWYWKCDRCGMAGPNLIDPETNRITD